MQAVKKFRHVSVQRLRPDGVAFKTISECGFATVPCSGHLEICENFSAVSTTINVRSLRGQLLRFVSRQAKSAVSHSSDRLVWLSLTSAHHMNTLGRFITLSFVNGFCSVRNSVKRRFSLHNVIALFALVGIFTDVVRGKCYCVRNFWSYWPGSGFVRSSPQATGRGRLLKEFEGKKFLCP